MSQTGCAFLVLNASTFLNFEFKNNLNNRLNITVTLTEEGTGESVSELCRAKHSKIIPEGSKNL